MHGSWAASYLALWALVIVLTVVVVTLARQVGSLSARLPSGGISEHGEGPQLGTTPEPMTILDPRGNRLTVGGPGRGQLLVFVAPGCAACELFLPALPAIAQSAGVTPYIVTAADAAEAEREFSFRQVGSIISSPQILDSYNVDSTPYAVVLDRLGAVRAKGTVGSIEQIERLVELAARPSSRPAPDPRPG
jgi:methylamine dehydrogenase accessory protein MauD